MGVRIIRTPAPVVKSTPSSKVACGTVFEGRIGSTQRHRVCIRGIDVIVDLQTGGTWYLPDGKVVDIYAYRELSPELFVV